MLCLPFDGSRLILESYFLFLGGRCHSWIRGRNPLLGHSPRIGPIVSAVRCGSRRSLLLFALSDRLLHFRVFLHAQLAMLWRRRRLLVPTICPPRALLLDCPCLLTLSSAFSWSCAVPLPVAMLFLRIQMRSFDPCVLSCPAGRSMPSMDSRSQSSARALAEYRTHRLRGPMWESAQPARFSHLPVRTSFTRATLRWRAAECLHMLGRPARWNDFHWVYVVRALRPGPTGRLIHNVCFKCNAGSAPVLSPRIPASVKWGLTDPFCTVVVKWGLTNPVAPSS